MLEPIGSGRRFDTGAGTGIVTAVGMTGSSTAAAPTASHSEIEPGFGTHAIDQAVEDAHGYLTARKKTLEALGIKVDTEVRIGDPATQIRLIATELGSGLIVMATHRATQVSRGVLGSVMDRVVRAASVPVMAVHPSTLDSLEKVKNVFTSAVVPLDGSEESEQAVPLALEVAGPAGAEVVFATAVRPRFMGFFRGVAMTGQRQTELELYLERFVGQAEERCVNASGTVREGDPDEVIREVAEESPGSLIVMSSHGASGFKRMMLGSVTDKVVRSSRRPVIVVCSPEST